MLVTFIPKYLKDRDLRLRRVGMSDLPFLSEILVREDILRSSGLFKLNRSSCISFYFWLRNTFPVAYFIELESETIGFIGLSNLAPGGHAEVSLVLFDPIFRRRGYGTRAFELLRRSHFTSSLTDALIAKVRKENMPARSFWRGLGFETIRDDKETIIMKLANDVQSDTATPHK